LGNAKKIRQEIKDQEIFNEAKRILESKQRELELKHQLSELQNMKSGAKKDAPQRPVAAAAAASPKNPPKQPPQQQENRRPVAAETVPVPRSREVKLEKVPPVQHANHQENKQQHSESTIFVRGMGRDSEKADLMYLFQDYGNIVKVEQFRQTGAQL
jgi:type IV secretory pathway VirB10-like protein